MYPDALHVFSWLVPIQGSSSIHLEFDVQNAGPMGNWHMAMEPKTPISGGLVRWEQHRYQWQIYQPCLITGG